MVRHTICVCSAAANDDDDDDDDDAVDHCFVWRCHSSPHMESDLPRELLPRCRNDLHVL